MNQNQTQATPADDQTWLSLAQLQYEQECKRENSIRLTSIAMIITSYVMMVSTVIVFSGFMAVVQGAHLIVTVLLSLGVAICDVMLCYALIKLFAIKREKNEISTKDKTGASKSMVDLLPALMGVRVKNSIYEGTIYQFTKEQLAETLTEAAHQHFLRNNAKISYLNRIGLIMIAMLVLLLLNTVTAYFSKPGL